MSDFTRGILLGSGNLFGDDDDADQLRKQNHVLVEQLRLLRAEVAHDNALLDALKNGSSRFTGEGGLDLQEEVG